MEFNTKQELYDYLNNFDFDSVIDTKLSSIYFLVEFDNHIEPIYFAPFEDVWFESPCVLNKYSFKDNEDYLTEYVEETYYKDYWEDGYKYEKTMVRNGIHYNIVNWQCEPFLPDRIKVVGAFSDSQCLDWLLEQEGNN